MHRRERQQRHRSVRNWILLCCLSIVATLSLVWSTVVLVIASDPPSTAPGSSGLDAKCEIPRIRREWRSLNAVERSNYIQAVQCVQKLPSKVTESGSLYDDFVYIHMLIGRNCMSLSAWMIVGSVLTTLQPTPQPPSCLGTVPFYTYTSRT